MKLQNRLLLVLLPLTFLSGGLILLLSKQPVYTILVEGVAQRGLAQLNALSAKAGAGMRLKDEKELLPLLNAAAGQARASYAMALDPSGAVLAHTNVLEKGKRYDDAVTRRVLGRDKPGFELVEVQGKELLDVAVPVWANEDDFILAQEKEGRTRLGSIRLGLPLEEALATKDQILGRIALIILLAGLAETAVIVLALRKALHPIGLLTRSAERIGGGERDLRIPLTTKDEIGHLAASFNAMVDDLNRATDYMDNIIRSMADSLLVVAPDGRIKTANKAALELLGYAESELVGRPLDALIGGGGEAVFSAGSLEKLLREGSLRDQESFYKTKTGEKVPVLLSGSFLSGAQGKSEGIVVLAKDIRERKKMEMLLVQSEKLSAVGQLAAGVAHEINNPLATILGFAQAAAKRIQAADPLALPIKSIEREALRCKILVQDLLAFSRQKKSRLEPFDLNETVSSTLSIIEAQARVKSVEVLKELGGVEPVLGDKNQLQQVIVNLCSNAIDAMPKGGRILVRTRGAGTGKERRAVLEVEDNGEGIPEEIRDKIFNPFFTTKEVGKGTGLGLALIHEIVQRHEGTIEVRSEVGRGTTFIVSLPVAARREPELSKT